MRFVLVAALVTVGCAAAGQPMESAIDAPPDEPPCVDTDLDGACNFEDQCPGEDDRLDVNNNSTPDCLETQMRMVDLKMVGTNHGRGWQRAAGLDPVRQHRQRHDPAAGHGQSPRDRVPAVRRV